MAENSHNRHSADFSTGIQAGAYRRRYQADRQSADQDRSEDLLPLVDQSTANSGKSHKAVTADCGFCDYPILEEVETRRAEEFYLPDRRYESGRKNVGKKKGTYGPCDFQEHEEGGYSCPAGKQMEYKGTCTINKHPPPERIGKGGR